MGTRDDPENFYPALDVVALTSLNEGTPLTLIEAMANARAVVATAVGGVVDLLGANLLDNDSLDKATASLGAGQSGAYTVCERGVLVRPDDPEAFCRGLALVIENKDLRHAMGERGRLFVERNHSREQLVTNIASLYDELLASKAANQTSLSARQESSQFAGTPDLEGD